MYHNGNHDHSAHDTDHKVEGGQGGRYVLIENLPRNVRVLTVVCAAYGQVDRVGRLRQFASVHQLQQGDVFSGRHGRFPGVENRVTHQVSEHLWAIKAVTREEKNNRHDAVSQGNGIMTRPNGGRASKPLHKQRVYQQWATRRLMRDRIYVAQLGGEKNVLKLFGNK